MMANRLRYLVRILHRRWQQHHADAPKVCGDCYCYGDPKFFRLRTKASRQARGWCQDLQGSLARAGSAAGDSPRYAAPVHTSPVRYGCRMAPSLRGVASSTLLFLLLAVVRSAHRRKFVTVVFFADRSIALTGDAVRLPRRSRCYTMSSNLL